MMKSPFSTSQFQRVLLSIVIVIALYCLISDDFTLRTPDQKAYRLFEQKEYQLAAESFTDPMWKGVALFKQGKFEDAADVFSGFDTAEGAFNHGNALVMRGQYTQAAERYARAIELRPEWQAAVINRDIALARAKMLEKQGSDMTGGQLEADEFVFSDKKRPPATGQEPFEAQQEMTDTELQAVWLRQVHTKPADFLRSKFAYQYAKQERNQ